MSIEGRMRGTFLGMAIGDALGAAVEFRQPGSFPEVTGFRGGGPHGLGPGEWTDDTSMALALADSLVQAGWDLSDQLHRYIDWRQNGRYSVNGRCFDIGITVSGALSAFVRDGDPRSCASSDDRSSGNGSIMRLAPIPIRFFDHFPSDLDELLRLADESSITTHASGQCRSACRYMTLLLCGLIAGESRETVLSSRWAPLRRLRAIEPLHPAVEEIAAGSFRDRNPPEIRGSGYVVHTLEASLWAFAKAESFSEAVLRVVNLGEDADTTGAVCGQIAGACWGLDGIPAHWLNGLARRDILDPALDALLTSRDDPRSPQRPRDHSLPEPNRDALPADESVAMRIPAPPRDEASLVEVESLMKDELLVEVEPLAEVEPLVEVEAKREAGELIQLRLFD